MEQRARIDAPRPVSGADVARSDLISWSSIWAGVLSAFGLFVLLGVLALAAGLVVQTGGTPKFGAAIASIITALFLIVAFFVGGFIAAWTAHIEDVESATLHGFLVWALFVVFLVVLAAAGLGAAFGNMTSVFSGSFNPATPKELTDAGWVTVFGFMLAVTASVLGALVATRPEVRRNWPFAD